MPTVVSDNESSAHVISCPCRPITLSSWLTDSNNDTTLELSIHKPPPSILLPPRAILKPTQGSNKWSAKEALSVLSDGMDDEIEEIGPQKGKHLCHVDDVNSPDFIDDGPMHSDDRLDDLETPDADMSSSQVTTGTIDGMCGTSTQDVTPIDDRAFLKDVDVQDVSQPATASCKDKGHNISAFFGKSYPHKSKDGKTCNVRDCVSCK
ncbi:hypothetical protein DFH29DRAFT_882291 [Suillus ampliporus]|nr:hypothetical protein DFH29DRAFT_882291 [Suillus ampliporus]